MSWQKTVKPVIPKLAYGRSGECGAKERALIPGELPSRPEGLLGQQWSRKGEQQSAEAIVSATWRRRAEREAQGGEVDFAEMKPQKSEQLTFDFSARGEARKRWGKGRQACAADTAGEAKADPAAPALAQGLVEAMLRGHNVERALRRVEANRGAPGVDGMRTEALRPYLRAHWGRLKQELLEGRYRPQPVKRVEIPKPDGGVRELGIPTVVDRFVQQLVLQVMEPLYEPTFSPHSYGFRPGKSARSGGAGVGGRPGPGALL